VGGVLLFIVFLWFLVLKPLQQTLELRLQQYPAQLLSIQDLNQTLSIYKNKDLGIIGLSEETLAAM
jgi:hypothetical protein